MVSGGHWGAEGAGTHARESGVLLGSVWQHRWITRAYSLLSCPAAGRGTQPFSPRWSDKITARGGQAACQEPAISFFADTDPGPAPEGRWPLGPGGCVTVPCLPPAWGLVRSCGPSAISPQRPSPHAFGPQRPVCWLRWQQYPRGQFWPAAISALKLRKVLEWSPTASIRPLSPKCHLSHSTSALGCSSPLLHCLPRGCSALASQWAVAMSACPWKQLPWSFLLQIHAW